MSPPNERGPASQPSPQETGTAAPSSITRTDGGTPAVLLDRPVTSISIPPGEADLRFVVNTIVRERPHWWLFTPAGQAQREFLQRMGWWS